MLGDAGQPATAGGFRQSDFRPRFWPPACWDVVVHPDYQQAWARGAVGIHLKNSCEDISNITLFADPLRWWILHNWSYVQSEVKGIFFLVRLA